MKMTDPFYAEVGRWRRSLHFSRLGAPLQVQALLRLTFANRELFLAQGALASWPAKSTLAAITGRSRRSVIRNDAALVAAGVLAADPAGGDRRKTSFYVFETRWLHATEVEMERTGIIKIWERVLPLQATGDRTDTCTGDNLDTCTGVKVVTQPSEAPIDEPPERAPRVRAREAGPISARIKARPASLRASPASTASSAKARARAEPSSADASSRTLRQPARPPRRRNTPSAARVDAFKRFQPSAETIAYLSEHCSLVKDWDAPHWVDEFINYRLGEKGIPADFQHAFRAYMDYRQKWAIQDQAKPTRRNGRSAFMEAAVRPRTHEKET
jgi:hypothetical protein